MVKPIFVTGSSRSGTTMVGRVLNQHPNVRTFPEIHFFEQMCELRSLTHELSVDDAGALMDRLIGTMEEGFLHYGRGGRYQAKAAEWLRGMSGPLSPREIYAVGRGLSCLRPDAEECSLHWSDPGRLSGCEGDCHGT